MSKVFVKRFILNEDVQSIIDQSYDKVVCQEWTSQLPVPSNVNVQYSEEYRVQGTHIAYAENAKVVESLFNKIGNRLKINQIDIQPAATKLLYWTNYKIGAIQYVVQKLNQSDNITDKTNFFEENYFKSVLKTIKYFLDNNSNKDSNYKTAFDFKFDRSYKIGILVNNSFELGLYQYIIKELPKDDLVVFHYGNIDTNGFDCHFVNVNINVKSKQKFINPLALNQKELYALNVLLKDYKLLTKEIQIAQIIKNSGIRKLLVNEAENLAHRNLLKSVLGDQVCIYNTMNGLKSGEAQDTDVRFDKWFVWDQEMKSFMLNYTNLSADNFIVSGHLAQDAIEHHKNENSLELKPEQIENKLLVSIFSVRGKRPEKQDVFNVYYDLIKKRSDIFTIIKPHPLEKESDYHLDGFNQENMVLVPEKFKNSKQALYDILKITDLCVVFNSTIAIECKWMNVPCINVEYREKSMIYLKSDNQIFHVKNKKEFEEQIVKNLKKNHPNLEQNPIKVYKKIAEQLLN